MPSGGARPGSGVRPDPNALRRDRPQDKATWTTLSATPRTEPAPPWPLIEQTPREAELWTSMWAKPQAELWSRNLQAEQVALFVRAFAEAEQPGAATPLRTLVRQMSDALLLTIPAMLAARVRIAPDEVEQARTAKAAPATPARPSARDRLKAVAGGGA